jgi:alpha-galactosidase
MKSAKILLGIFSLLLPGILVAKTVWLDELDLSQAEQDWGKPTKNKSVAGHPLTIAGKTFERGFGTHAVGTLNLDLKGGAESFTASVGVDDEVTSDTASVEFRVIGDGKILSRSGVMHRGDAAKSLNANLHGVKNLTLLVTDGEDGNAYDHADWADARFEISGAAPTPLGSAHEEPYILTPKPAATPRINGAKVVGCRPGHDFLFTIAATGDRPMTFSAKGLPAGLALDEKSGIISGAIRERGNYVVTLHAKNARGSAERKLTIKCGDQIALTPPMGWNSWNCFASAVTAEKVKAAADAMVASGLINHGWTYINIDDFWEVNRNSKDPTLQGPQRDANGNILPNPRFPDMKGLADYVHSKGLRIGLYSSPGPWTCGGCVASFDHELQDARQYGAWGFDYLKYDWCSYRPDLESHRGNSSNFVQNVASWNGMDFTNRAQLIRPYQIMRAALDQVPRDILFSLCQYGMGNVWEWGADVGGNCWRTTGDITDTWNSLSRIGFAQNGHEKFAGPGHWNDPDMLIVGKVGWGPALHPTRLTPNEQYTHISLWCLLDAPLLIGCDMTQLDDFTLSLLTNDEVLEVNQDPLGKQAARISKNGDLEIWAKQMEDGSLAIGLFNRGNAPTKVTAHWADLGIKGKHRVRDLWRQKDLGKFANEFSADVPRHGVVLVRVF